jgi:hypothetical protein
MFTEVSGAVDCKFLEIEVWSAGSGGVRLLIMLLIDEDPEPRCPDCW